jgi:tRNA_anti-like
MVLKACRECQQQVSGEAKYCPHCGARARKWTAGRVALWMVGVWGGLTVLGLIVGEGSSRRQPAAGGASAAPPAADSEVTYSVDAVRLYEDYDANELAADRVYKGKSLLVAGTVIGIDKDVMGNILVRFATSNLIASTIATMRASEANAAETLRKGAQLAVYCRGAGRSLGMPILRDCTFARQ